MKKHQILFWEMIAAAFIGQVGSYWSETWDFAFFIIALVILFFWTIAWIFDK